MTAAAHCSVTRAVLVAAFAAAFAMTSQARADEPGRVEKARALFSQGKELLAAGQLKEACDAFQESETLDRAGGTLLNLAECRVQLGQIATAILSLEEARRLADEAKREDARAFADDRIKALLPRTDLLQIEPPAVVPKKLSVTVDGRELDLSASPYAQRVDPGEHTITARAPGFVDSSIRVTLRGEGVSISVALPALQPEKPAPPTSSPPVPVGPKPEPEGRRARVIAGWSLIAAGAAGIVAGSVLGSFAIARANRSKTLCPKPQCGSVDGIVAAHESGALADGATASLSIGGTFAVAGVVLVVTAQPPHVRSPQSATRVSLWVPW